MTAGVQLSHEPVPDWFQDFEDAELLGVPVWQIDEVPMHWRLKARTVNLAKKEARIEIFNKIKGQKMIVIGPDV